MMGDMIVRWTARLAVGCYLARILCDAHDSRAASMRKMARLFWTIGCVIFVIHVAAAFHFEHGWDHASAFEHTAKRTNEMTGWNSGVGLYINELFLCLWVADTVWWWRDLAWPLTHRRVYWFIQSIFAFLMFQATIVFGPFFWKPFGTLILIILAFQWITRRRNQFVEANSANETSAG